MKKTTNVKSLFTKLMLVALLVTTLATVLVGCTSTTTPKLSLSPSEINPGEESQNALSVLELEKIRDVLVEKPEAFEQFVAAYRGYDMTEENFDPKADRPALDPLVEAAKNVLNTLEISGVNYENINEADMLLVINSLKIKVDIEEGDRGFLDSIKYYIGVAIRYLSVAGFGSYIVGICLFAIIVELLMSPFAIKQQKNSIKQASLRPKEMAIRKKYAGRNDQATQQKINQEIQELYQKEGFNPMGGCLPLLLQFPIIIILYEIVVNPISYVLGLSQKFSAAITTFCSTAKAAGGLGIQLSAKTGTIEALSHINKDSITKFGDFMYLENGAECAEKLGGIQNSIPSFNIGSLNFGLTPISDFTNWLWIIPVLTFVVYFFGMKLTRKFSAQPVQTDAQIGCSNNVMDFTMPLMSVYIAFITPAAIGVYWIFRSILNTLKAFIMSRIMPLPTFTEEDYKAAEKEMKARAKGQPYRGDRPAGSADGTKPRSLHYIDADDDEPAPAPKQTKKTKEKAEEPTDEKVEEITEDKVEEKTADSSIAPAPMKDENDKPNHNNEGQEE